MPLPRTPQTLASAFWQGFYDYAAGFTGCPFREEEEAEVWGLGFDAHWFRDNSPPIENEQPPA